MKRQTRSAGYTIVEVMIFLVITGALLISAMAVFNGRQRRTQFTQGVREIDTQIRTIINETASGFYPKKNELSCTSNGAGPLLDEANVQQGQNTGCIFLGRIMAFTSGDKYRVYTLVGQRRGADQNLVTQYGQTNNQAKQTLVARATGAQNDKAPTDAYAEFSMPWGITVRKIVMPGGATIGATGFVYSLGSYDSSGTNLVSASTSLNSAPLSGTSLSSSDQQLVDRAKVLTNSNLNPGKITICLLSGGGDRRAAIIIGGNNNNVGTEVIIDETLGECNV